MNKKGFTLIELILYLAIVSIVLMSLIPFAWNIIGGSVKSQAEQEVSSQARFISEKIKSEIRNAKGINSITSSSISLVEDPPNNPTIIDLATDKIRIKQGTGATTNLNSNDTTVTSLNFTDYTSVDNKTKHIQFTFTLDDAYGSSRQEYQAPAITIETSAEIRNN